MRTKEIFKIALEVTGTTQARLAEISGEPEQSIGQMINVRQTVKLRYFLRMLYYLGISMKLYTQDGQKEFLEVYEESPNVPEMFKKILELKNMTLDQAAEAKGVSTIALREKVIVRGSIKSDEFLSLMDLIGVNVHFFVKATGEQLTKKVKQRRRVVGMSDGVIFDTREAQIVASSFYADSENEYGPDGKAQELYVDRDNRYFVAEYSKDESIRDRVRSVPAHMATAFIKQYGIIEGGIPV